MDVHARDPLLRRIVLVAMTLPFVAWTGQHYFGDTGVGLALMLALTTVALLFRLDGQSAAGRQTATGNDVKWQTDRVPSTDSWRSDRWVEQTAREGIEKLDSWRRRQDQP